MKRPMGTTARGPLCALAALGLASPAMAQTGYAWANEPSSLQYQPSALYSHNSGGGSVTIGRSGVGAYTVRFAGLGGKGTGGGHVEVTAYGAGSENCKVTSWNYAAPDFTVRVSCFTAGGSPADTWFTILAGWPNGSRSSGSTASMAPIQTSPLPPGSVGKADAATSADVTALSNQINALYRMIETLRTRVNELSK